MLCMMLPIQIYKMLLIITTLVVHFASAKENPLLKFLGPETNVTVVVGRDATLTCMVEKLYNYKVAWLRVDTQTILTIGPHVITKNHRIAVTKADQTWALTLRDVRLTDGGRYMCQINTEPMITQTHHLHVFVPPDIVDSESSGEVIVREGDNVTLHCAASGTPDPTIVWRREDSAQMLVGRENVTKWSGAWLNMSSVNRDMNGAYFCIATNGVPPSVSKRILLHILCKPTVEVVQKLVGGYLGHAIILQCKIEANPLTSVFWTHTDVDGAKLINGSKYQASIKSKSYKHTASLRIADVSREDIGAYYCHVENPLGTSHDDVTLYTLVTTTSTTISTTDITAMEAKTTDLAVLSSAVSEINLREEKYPEEGTFVVVLSQHQMQNPDLSPSS